MQNGDLTRTTATEILVRKSNAPAERAWQGSGWAVTGPWLAFQNSVAREAGASLAVGSQAGAWEPEGRGKRSLGTRRKRKTEFGNQKEEENGAWEPEGRGKRRLGTRRIWRFGTRRKDARLEKIKILGLQEVISVLYEGSVRDPALSLNHPRLLSFALCAMPYAPLYIPAFRHVNIQSSTHPVIPIFSGATPFSGSTAGPRDARLPILGAIGVPTKGGISREPVFHRRSGMIPSIRGARLFARPTQCRRLYALEVSRPRRRPDP